MFRVVPGASGSAEVDQTTLSERNPRQSISKSRSTTGGRLKCQVEPVGGARRSALHDLVEARNG